MMDKISLSIRSEKVTVERPQTQQCDRCDHAQFREHHTAETDAVKEVDDTPDEECNPRQDERYPKKIRASGMRRNGKKEDDEKKHREEWRYDHIVKDGAHFRSLEFLRQKQAQRFVGILNGIVTLSFENGSENFRFEAL